MNTKVNDRAQEIRKKAVKKNQETEKATQLTYENAAIKIFDWILDNIDSLISSGSDMSFTATEILSNPNTTEIRDKYTHNTFDMEQILKELKHLGSSKDIKRTLFNTLKSYICNQPGYYAEIKSNLYQGTDYDLRIQIDLKQTNETMVN